ncbi:hypothetical protein AQS8620_03105 [Aquimixticola soesokkakensis]|uniref:Uncharacterized protein n=1 Tax=Aquimixticola soesokkakensis TaxID=1519096 RepID=A0A1Y5TSA2_9RHOB|nr:hypothetical protein [Aquimixticola soesokkakensis]SLN66818.1 hypothetical protein AQS8620_03105 [Aquimixticola soesokkakensis]
MSVHTNIRGGAPVGALADLDPVDARAVTYFRMWCHGATTRTRLREEVTAIMGTNEGLSFCRCLRDLHDVTVHYGRRALMCHQVNCSCLGADECALAHLIGAAREGAREDAMLLASLIVRPDIAHGLSALAGDFGIGLDLIERKSRSLRDHTRH